MLTVRHLERLWESRKYDKLLEELIQPRIEALAVVELSQIACAAAALGLVRLEELNQSHAGICPKLIRFLVSMQENDGGWGDVATTSLCLRALSLQNGYGEAIDRGMAYMGVLQQADGIWPKIPIRRMPEDAVVSAFALLQLGGNERFRAAVRFEEAYDWFESHGGRIESSARILWAHARVASGVTARGKALELSWS